MYIARASMNNDVIFGVVEGLDAAGEPDENTVFIPMEGHPYSPEPQLTGPRIPLGEMRLLAPVLPSKIICAAKNYADHAAEMDGSVAEEPVLFLKPSTSVIGAGSPILLPGASDRVDHEAELAVVIGRLCKSVPVDRVDEVILGYTCANDVTARDLQARDGQWGRAKGFDSFCPLGPWITTEFDPDQARLICEVDGEVRQSGSTADMVHKVRELVAYVSDIMTLLPGDVILTGTPAGIGPIIDGQTVEIHIPGIGTLSNEVKKRD